MGAAAIPIATALIGTAVSYENTRRTENRQDAALAASLRSRNREQQRVDQRVNDEIQRLGASTSDDERRASLDSYTSQLRTNRRTLESGLAPTVGSATFRSDAASRAGQVNAQAAATAGLMSRIDAPTDQRRGESVSMGRLGEDLAIAARETAGNSYLDQLRLNAIRRSPWLDLAAAGIGAAGGTYAGAGARGASTGATLNANARAASPSLFGPYAAGYGYPTRPGYYAPPTW